jgi:hypothetical protein
VCITNWVFIRFEGSAATGAEGRRSTPAPKEVFGHMLFGGYLRISACLFVNKGVDVPGAGAADVDESHVEFPSRQRRGRKNNSFGRLKEAATVQKTSKTRSIRDCTKRNEPFSIHHEQEQQKN